MSSNKPGLKLLALVVILAAFLAPNAALITAAALADRPRWLPAVCHAAGLVVTVLLLLAFRSLLDRIYPANKKGNSRE